MFARSVLAAALVAALLGPAQADGVAMMSLNSVATDKLPHADCMTRARAAIEAAGFSYFDTTTEAVWGQANDHRDMVSVYCPKSTFIAVFAAGSPTGQGSVTEPLVNRLIAAWRKLNH